MNVEDTLQVKSKTSSTKAPKKKDSKIITECCGKELNSKSLAGHQKICKMFNKVVI